MFHAVIVFESNDWQHTLQQQQQQQRLSHENGGLSLLIPLGGSLGEIDNCLFVGLQIFLMQHCNVEDFVCQEMPKCQCVFSTIPALLLCVTLTLTDLYTSSLSRALCDCQ